MGDDSAVIGALTEAVLGVNGVIEIYPVPPRLPNVAGAAGAVLSAIRSADTSAPRTVGLSRDANTVEIRTHIGVDGSRATPVVTREVSEALEQTATRLLGSAVTLSIRVRVSSIG